MTEWRTVGDFAFDRSAYKISPDGLDVPAPGTLRARVDALQQELPALRQTVSVYRRAADARREEEGQLPSHRSGTHALTGDRDRRSCKL